MQLRAFISREQTEGSPFRRILEAQGWLVHGQSLVQFTPLAPMPVPEADWHFFSSQQAARFFLNSQWQFSGKTPFRYAAIGPATAALVTELSGQVPDFVGTGDPVETALLFKSIAAGTRVLFPAAVHARLRIRELLGPDVVVLALSVYDNRPIEVLPDLRDFRVLAFTSPMNAQAYFAKNAPQAQQQILAIGRSTTAALEEMGVLGVCTAVKAGEGALADLVRV